MRHTAPSSLLIVSAAALLGFAYTATLVARRRTEGIDNEARDEVQAARAPAGDAAAKASGPLGKEYLHFPVACGIALALERRGLGPRAAVPVLASVTSEFLNRLVTLTLHIRVVPPGHPEHSSRKPSFPSGHAMETTAVAFASAYVLAREKITPTAPAFAVAAILATSSAVGRLVLDRHWATDAVGGGLLGVAVAAASAAAYESLPQESFREHREQKAGMGRPV